MEQNSKPRHSPQRVTLKAVAQAAGVSPITVSNVVNGRFQAMSAKTRKRVEAAITRLGYRVNLAARGLRRSHHYSTALIFVDQRPAFLAQPAHHHLAAGLANYLNSHGYSLTIEGVSPDRFEDISFLDRLSADALCLVASGPIAERQAMLERLQATRHPLLVFHEPPMAEVARTCFVRADDRGAGKLMARHVIEQGARRILLLLPRRDWAPMTERAVGIKAAQRGAKEARVQTLRVDGLTVAEVGAALDAYLKENEAPDAVLAGNDLLAAAAQRYFSQAGYRIPGQVRIGGFGGYDLVQYLHPTLTSVRIPSYAMGQAAGQEILHAMTHGQFSQNDTLLPVELVRGEST